MSEKDFSEGFPDDELDESDLAPDLISLIDDDGNESEFEILDTYDSEEGHYIAIIPYTPDSEEDDEAGGDLLILKAVEDEGEEDGEFYYAPIEDEEEFNRISNLFIERLEEYYDIIEEPETEE